MKAGTQFSDTSIVVNEAIEVQVEEFGEQIPVDRGCLAHQCQLIPNDVTSECIPSRRIGQSPRCVAESPIHRLD